MRATRLKLSKLQWLRIALAVSVGIVAAILFLHGGERLSRQQAETSLWVSRTLEVLAHTSALEADLATAVSEGRGYLASKAPASATRFRLASDAVAHDMSALQQQVQHNPTQLAKLEQMRAIADTRISFLKQVVDHTERGEEFAALALARSQRGRALMDEFVALSNEFKAEERRLLSIRSRKAAETSQRIVTGLVICSTMVAASALALSMFAVLRRRERQHLDRLQSLNATLEAEILARTEAACARELEARTYFESSPIAKLVTCVSHGVSVINGVNAAAEALLGVTREAAVGRELAAVLPHTIAGQLQKLSDLTLADPTAHGCAIEIERPDGNRMLDVVMVRVPGETSDGPRVLSCIRDVTEQRLLEQHLATARDRAERANHAKSRFLTSISHELRTPLNGILGYAQLLRLENALTNTQRTRVDAMLAAGDHLMGMINSVLDLAHIESERLILQPEHTDVAALAAICLDLVRPAANAKHIELDLVTASAPSAQIMADATRLRQVLVNLLGNAVKFTADGYVTLEIRPGSDPQTLRFEIRDTGPGIAAENLLRLFHEFERFGSSEGIEGSGLGLAITAMLVRRMQGQIGYTDNAGRGSVFWFEIPIDAQGETVPHRIHRPADPAMKLRILVVDDVDMNREVAAGFLRHSQHQVVCVDSGFAAIETLQAAVFDVVLMDVRMPGMDGVEATRRIRKLAGPCSEVPIIALTAQAFADQIEACRKAGMNGHVSKPLERSALLAAIADVKPRPTVNPSAAAEPPTAAETSELILDQDIYGATVCVLPPRDLRTFLDALVDRTEALLQRLTAPEAEACSELVHDAHKLGGSAGTFGFRRLAQAAAAFEHAVECSGQDAAAHRDELRRATEASIGVLRDLATAA